MGTTTWTVGDAVYAGEGEGRDSGIIRSIEGNMAMVAWDSGCTTECPIDALESAPRNRMERIEGTERR